MGVSVEELRLVDLFKQDEQTPHHEAGHAVVMAWLKLPFVGLTMKEDEGGEMTVPLLPKTYRRDYTDSAIGCAAGQAANSLHEEFSGNPCFDWDNSKDNNEIRILGMLAGCFTTEDQRGWFNYVRRYAESILRIPYVWAAVEELSRKSVELGGDREVPADQAMTMLLACMKGERKADGDRVQLRSS